MSDVKLSGGQEGYHSPCRKVKRREVPSSEVVHLGAVSQEQLHDDQAVLAGRVVKGGHLVYTCTESTGWDLG